MTSSESTATITPHTDACGCDKDGCENADLLALVEPDTINERRILCPTHRVEWLREVSER